MRTVQRGAIQHREYAQQLRDFTGLRFGNKTPTDLDCFLDFGGSMFVFVEGKHDGAPLPFGQRLAFENLTNACQAGGVESLLLVADHTGAGDVPYATILVRCSYYRGVWRPAPREITVRAAIESFQTRLS